MEANTASLRGSAPRWSLAGDKQLLDILQNIHQSLVTRCSEVNQRLDEMVSALDGASVDLQNVNNKFMALSNSQFIESRVYDDDVDVAAREQPQEASLPHQEPSPLDNLKSSIRALESAHELIEIIDTDSDSDDEEGTRTVLKPRDRYGSRPLPHIIGTPAWKDKWHAGLHPEDSDSCSSGSGPGAEPDQYSDSEPEGETLPHARREIEESTGSSELTSEEVVAGSVPVRPSPADVAAELARRLGGEGVKIPAPEPEYLPPNPIKKVYRPDQPSIGTVFCDEPPPLDETQSDPEDDIFAELHHSGSQFPREGAGIAGELFGKLEGDQLFGEQVTSSTPAKTPALFDSEPELFNQRQAEVKPQTDAVKKPVGAISLFGNNNGAESIGAAILKRNQKRHSSEEDSDTPPPPPKNDVTPPRNKEKDIFDDLFAKSEKEQKRTKQKDVPKEVSKSEAKVDLFSDNLFDDIDDIFTSDVIVKKDKKDSKPLFDHDDDDLFADIAVTKDIKDTTGSKKKSIFDSDDDLFSENVKKPEVTSKSDKVNKIHVNKPFEDVDDIFSDIVESKTVETKTNIVNVVAEDITETKNEVRGSIFEDENVKLNNNKILDNEDEPLFSNSNKREEGNRKENILPNNNLAKASKSLFSDEDDDDDDELFAKKPTPSDENSNLVKNIKSEEKSSKTFNKPSLFGDDSDEGDLFGSTATKPQITKNDNTNSNLTSIENPIKSTLSTTESNNIFDNTSASDDIFAIPTKSNSDSSQKVNKSNNINPVNNLQDISVITHEEPPKLNKNTLFDDDDSDDSNLFGTIVKKPEIEQKPAINEVKPKLDQPEHSKIEQNVISNEEKPILQEKPTIKERPTLAEVKKPAVSNQKPSLKQKTQVKEAEPDIKEERLTKEKSNTEPVKIDDIDIKVETTPNVVENKTSVDVENSSKEQTENVSKEEQLFSSKQHSVADPILSTESEIPEFISESKTEQDKSVNKEKYALLSESQSSLFQSPPVFDDIFSEPPAFEKSAEPKRSKNVNALFDDDSDDEALFFKKNDVTLDEKPDVTPDGTKDALFGIFHDEPPAIDVDFTQKAKKSDLNDDFLNSDDDDDFFTIKSKKELPKSTTSESSISKTVKSDEILPKSSTQEIDNVPKQTPVIDKTEKVEQKLNTESKIHKDTTDTETRKVGKLKTMNFNIDVSTLLPGASPKKKSVEQTDGQAISTKSLNLQEDNISKTNQAEKQILSTKSHEDLHTKDKVEPNVLKSISFDGEPDSNILDNKWSKERAKIQVKRRPSTRRARQEAVRKSVLELADDSTDNSSSFDEPPKVQKSRPKIKPDIPIVPKPDSGKVEPRIESEKPVEDKGKDIEQIKVSEDVTDLSEDLPEVQPENAKEEIKPTESKTNILDNSIDTTDSIHKDLTNENISNVTLKTDNNDFTKSENKIETKPQTIRNESKNVTSKIVYILNDEDIFSSPAEKTERPKLLNIVDDDNDDLFKNIGNSSKIETSTISTLGNTYKDISSNENEGKTNTDINKKDTIKDSSTIFDENKASISKNSSSDVKKVDSKPKKSLFDDLSDEESALFNSNTKKSTKSKSILDSDSEEDLFGGRKKETKDAAAASASETKDVKPKVEVKSSLFGDDDDDDDLFGVKVKSSVAVSPLPARSTKEMVSKPPEPVFDDPLSLLGADDD